MRGWLPFGVGPFIRDFLRKHREGYPYGVYQALREVKNKTSYSSVRRYFYILEKLNLIEFAREAPSKRPKLAPRRYYKLVLGREDHPAWVHVQVVAHPGTRFGGARHAEKLEEARRLHISLDDLALREDPQLARERKSLKI